MEDSINVDDLFGEPSSLDLGLPSPVSTKGLAKRLDEMRLSGCCQKIAWSRQGCIAYVSQDGLRVNIRHLRCQPSVGKWVLSDETSSLPVTEAHGGLPLVHLLWNETGSELAVLDSSGRLSIYTITTALNQIAGQRQATFDPDDDGNQVVGIMWLNAQRSVHAFHQAAKRNGRWVYSPFRRRPVGPFHPANKPSLICVTRSGHIRLVYQNPDNKWAEISAELKNTGYSDKLLTHAAIVATPGASIIIATHSLCRRICLYRVLITWDPAHWDPSQNKPGLPPQPFPVPSFRFVHCKVEMPCDVLSTNHNVGENTDGFQPYLYNLTRLEIIPGPLEIPAGSAAGPWIVAVFSSPLHAVPDEPGQQGPASVIVRWQLDTAPQALHPKFDEVVSKRNTNIQAKPKLELRRLEDIYLDRHVVSIDCIEYGNTVAVTHEDSSIAFYDQKTMTLLSGLQDTNTVTSLAQAGFHYPLESSTLYVGFSPNACVATVLDRDWQMQLRFMEHSFGAEDGRYDENKLSAALASLALTFCRGCGSDVNTDDILVIALRQLSPEAETTFVNEIYRALPINCNFTEEQDKLMNHAYIPRCLSLQAALGFKSRYKPRSLTSAIPWAILNLRHASMLFAFFFQYNRGAAPEPHDPDVLRMVFGNTKWALEFLHYILNGLFDLADDLENTFNNPEVFAQSVKSTASLPLVIVLSSMSRAFLRFICRGLRGIYAGYATTTTLSGDARVYYAEVCQTLDSSPVRIDVYEKFLAGVDSAVRHAYQAAAFGEAERPGPEKDLLVHARIQPVFIPAVAAILRQTIPALKPEIDRMAIYLGDYGWLGFGDDPRTEVYRRTRDVDVLKKVPLRRAITPAGHGNESANGEPARYHHNNAPASQMVRRRRCVRCCEVTGDTSFPRTLLAFRMVLKLGLLRSCLCGGMLTIEPGTGENTGNQAQSQIGNGHAQPSSTHQHSNPSRTPAMVNV